MADDPTWYTGTVKAILPEKGFGFVSCDESHARYGADVYLHSTQLANVEQGMQISFQVKVNAKGQPQAVDVCPADIGGLGFAAPAAQAWEQPWAQHGGKGGKRGRGRGTTSWHAMAPVAEPSVGDSWLQAVLEGGVHVGVPLVLQEIVEATGDHNGVVQAVKGWLVANSAHRTSYASAPARPKQAPPRTSPYGAAGYTTSGFGGKGNGRASAAAAIPVVGSGEARFVGVVSAIKRQTADRPAFGFVTCAEAKELYGDDVFLHSTQAVELQVGQRVSFEVQVNKTGRPQAVNVMLVE